MEKYKLTPFSFGANVDYEKNLNTQQLDVVKNGDGPALVLAGAGSGKTRVLIYRLAYLLDKGINPQNILLVTFTNKAAYEMLHRAEMLMKSTLSGLWAGTFHHIGNIILRREAHRLGFSSNFTILDKEDSKDLLQDCMEELGLLKKDKMFPQKSVISTIGGLALNCQTDVDQIITDQFEQIQEYSPQIKRILSYYRDKKKKSNTMDFDDLLSNWLTLLNDEEVYQEYSNMFKYILVDEYQDTNKLQFAIIKRLASVHNNILVVGDDAQSIYSFRGAEINNILNFPKIFSGAKVFKLETNYRSTPEILSLANQVIKHNINQFSKTLKSIRTSGEQPVIVKTKDVYQQAKFIGQRILELYREGSRLKEIAILFRSRFQALELEVELMKRNIPYVVRGGVKFFEQSHIKDVLAYLKAVINPQDELSFKRALSLHQGIGRGYAHKIWSKFAHEKGSLQEITKSLPARQQLGLKNFTQVFASLKETSHPQDAIGSILNFYKEYCHLNFDNPQERILDLEELAKMAVNYPTIKRFLIEFNAYEEFKGETLLNSSGEQQEVVVLSTIHQAKGLEWDTVFLIAFSDYDFPHAKALNSSNALEEERRLFYVTITRAKSLLYISYPETKYTFKNGLVVCRPSMFYFQIPTDAYEEISVDEAY